MSDCFCPLRAQKAPHQLAFVSRGRSLTFAEFDFLVDDAVSHLRRWGIGPGDRIALSWPPSAECIALFFAAWRLKASLCPLNPRLPPLQRKICVSRLLPKLYLTQTEVRYRLSDPGCESSLFLFTSGSTGMPKIAILSLSNLLTSAASAGKALDFQRGDRWLLSLPLYHVGGVGIVLRSVLGGGAIVLDERDPEITHLSYVPTQLYRSWPLYPKLKCLLVGGAPIASFPKRLPVHLTYGLTEMSSLVAARKGAPQIGGHFYLGHPLPGREVQIREDGEIWVKGETLFQGYWEKGAIIRPLNREGWFATGDLGKYDAREGLAICGRKDWMFISGGENIQPEEIESHLLRMEEIAEAVVVPLADPEFGMRPAAVVRTRDRHLTLADIRCFLSDFLPSYKIPIALYQLNKFPKKGLKVDRKKIFSMIDASHNQMDESRSGQKK